MGGHEGIACAGDAGDHHGGRGLCDDIARSAFGRGFAAIGHQDTVRTALDQGGGGSGGWCQTWSGTAARLLRGSHKAWPRDGPQRQQPLGLAGRGGGHPQIGTRQRAGEVAMSATAHRSGCRQARQAPRKGPSADPKLPSVSGRRILSPAASSEWASAIAAIRPLAPSTAI